MNTLDRKEMEGRDLLKAGGGAEGTLTTAHCRHVVGAGLEVVMEQAFLLPTAAASAGFHDFIYIAPQLLSFEH